VVRTACVDLPAFPLQLLLRRHPDWRGLPVAVVDADRPQGVLLEVNDRARACRVLPGMRYAAAAALARDLRAAEVAPAAIERAAAAVATRLRDYTPEVEPAAGEPGVLWLDATGLEPLYASLHDWARRVRGGLARDGLTATVVVGFGRFGSYAAAKSRRGVTVFHRAGDEAAAGRRVPLERLAFAPRVRDALDRLGVRTVGQFADLPAEGLGKRFGDEVVRLHRFVTGVGELPLQPERPAPPAVERLALDHPETHVARLMTVVEQLLQPLLETLAGRCQALDALELGFRFDRTGDHVEHVRPAAPTLDARQLAELIRLRLEAVRTLPDGVVEVVLAGSGVAAPAEQLKMFTARPRRDLRAANRALARVRAALGDGAVTRARLGEGHLPEASYAWEAVDELPAPRPVAATVPGRLVRRIYEPAVPLPARPRHEPDGWMLRDLKQGPVTRVLGPYVVSGGWWNRPVHREYHFAETGRGELLWLYYDRHRRRWFLQGRVE
jgi:protein ImuB